MSQPHRPSARQGGLSKRFAALSSSVEPLADHSRNLPTAAALTAAVPKLSNWSNTLDLDRLLTQLQLDALCVGEGDARTLDLPAHDAWLTLAQMDAFAQWTRPLLEHLGWYGGAAGQTASWRVTQALAGQALVECFLSVGPNAAGAADPHMSVSMTESSHSQVCEHIRSHIATLLNQPAPAVIDLMFYLLLRDSAPELLVRDVPDFLIYGRSLQSVALIHGVATLESLSRYAAIDAAYDSLAGLSAAISVSEDPDVVHLRDLSRVRPALLYAAAHQRITPLDGDLANASAEQIQQSLAFLSAEQNAHAKDIGLLFAAKAPDRRVLAEHMLSAANIPTWLGDQGIDVQRWPILQQHGLSIASSYNWDAIRGRLTGNRNATVRELVMMGEVYRDGQPDVPSAYHSAFEQFRGALLQGHSALIKRLLSEMPSADLQLLANSTVEVSRVAFNGQEGDFGVFLRCRRGVTAMTAKPVNPQAETFFEIIPASGIARRITQRFIYEIDEDHGMRGNLIGTVERDRENLARRIRARNTPLLDMDSDAYLSGTASRSSQHLHHPARGLLIPASEVLSITGTTAVDLDQLASKAAGHLLAHWLPIQEAEHRHATQWEQTWEKESQVADTVARLVVPFYGCVKDLSAGHHWAGVILGCGLDLIFALIPLGQFAGATVRLTRMAGQLTAETIAEEMTLALDQLLSGLAKQSGAVAALDVLKLSARVGRRGLLKLAEQVPALDRWLNGAKLGEFALEDGAYRVLSDAEVDVDVDAEVDAQGTARASVDAMDRVAVCPVGPEGAGQWRLKDPYDQLPFGPPLFGEVAAGTLQLSRFDSLSKGARVVPVREAEAGFFQFTRGLRSHPQLIEQETGVYQVLSQGEVYRLDTHQQPPLLKLQSLVDGAGDDTLQAEELLCRLRRGLEPQPCEGGLRMVKNAPPVTDQSNAGLLGRYASAATESREFMLMRRQLPGPSSRPGRQIDVWVHEGKLCRHAAAGTDKGFRAVTPLEIRQFGLPENVRYRQTVSGRQVADGRWRLSAGVTGEDAARIQDRLPAIEMDGIAEGVDDGRTLRALMVPAGDGQTIVVEADTGVFYKAAPPADATADLTFERLDLDRDAELLDAYLLNAEQYRLVLERPTRLVDRDNIARLLFDLRDRAPMWDLARLDGLARYEDYVAECARTGEANVLQGYASTILSSEMAQTYFVNLAKESMPDFQMLGASVHADRQEAAQILNELLPVSGRDAGWVALDAESLALPQTLETMRGQLQRSNLAYIKVETADGRTLVYYAVSGGERNKGIALKADLADSPSRTIGDATYIDARKRMQGVEPDPWFTSMPVLRSSGAITVRQYDRYLDAERLIASVLRQDLRTTLLRSIKVFTWMDTCRSCGGFVLPRLKLDFPSASFAVRYLREYSNG